MGPRGRWNRKLEASAGRPDRTASLAAVASNLGDRDAIDADRLHGILDVSQFVGLDNRFNFVHRNILRESILNKRRF